MKRDSLRLSLPRAITVRGYAVTRAPLGRFLEALGLLGDFPDQLAESLMGQGDLRELLTALKGCDARLLWQLMGRALKVAPAQTLRLVAALVGIDEERLVNDPAIGLDGLVELLAAWAEVNDLEGFFREAGALAAKWRALAIPKTGCSG